MKFLITLLLLALVQTAQAHASSDALVQLQAEGPRISQRLDIALRDLDRELVLDADGDGALSWGEVRARWPQIEALADAGLRLSADGAACQAQAFGAAQLERHGDGSYAVLQRDWVCPAAVRQIGIDYRLFASSDAGHRGLARLVGAAGEPLVLVPGAGVQALAAQTGGWLGFVREGIGHIASGLDHVLFLVTLLMVAVWRREGAAWTPRASARAAWVETFKLVTAFTLAHSITLGLAASGAINPPSRWVESLIALTVLLAALDNIRPFIPGPRWGMVGVFGLVHGVGFAGPLQDLGLRGAELIGPLLGFNLGVEIGQLLIVALLLPLAVALRAREGYRRWLVPAGSGSVAVLALVWLTERSLDLNLLP